MRSPPPEAVEGGIAMVMDHLTALRIVQAGAGAAVGNATPMGGDPSRPMSTASASPQVLRAMRCSADLRKEWAASYPV
eukprot:2148668-Pyramimonas_sp.AAC.1